MLEQDSQYIRSVSLKRDNILSYDYFPLNLPAIQNLDEIKFHPNVTYIIGENGMGKSTLLEGIAIALDEPEAALSPLRQMSMLARINELVNQGSQFIISTHSPIIMAYPDSKIIQFTEEGLSESKLEETQHYSIMKQFFAEKDRMLHHLFQ